MSLANNVEDAQSESALYNPNVQIAPSLEKVKAPIESNLGKGWFNLQVNYVDLIYFYSEYGLINVFLTISIIIIIH